MRKIKVCAAEKLLLVKILFEEVCFKTGFEGKEGIAVTESERKRIPYLGSREAKGTFSSEGVDAKRSVVRRRRRDLTGTQMRTSPAR